MTSDIYVEEEPNKGNEYFSRIMRFRNNRVARFFADNHGGIYKGWVQGNTTYNITRGAGTVSAKENGSYIVVWEH